MLQLYNLDKEKIRGLKAYKDYKIESELSSGDKTLSFLYPSHLCKEIIEECYIRTKKAEFVVKEIGNSGDYKSIVAVLNVEDLEGKVFESFETVNKNITEFLNLALAGTGWTIGTCDVTRRRTVRKTNSSSWEIIQEAKKRYRVDLEFNSLNKKINIFEKRGNDKGVYFSDALNLRDLDIQGNSYEFYTRIIAIGKDDIRVTLENFQYSKKVKTFIWKDERYTDIDFLREDAQAKLNEISKPYRAFAANVIDLSVISEKHKILAYGLGDTVTLVSKDKGVREKQRIAKMIEYPDEPERNTCEIANVTLKFEDIQKEFQDTTDTVDNITTDDGTVDGSTIDEISTKQIYDFEASVGKITDLTVVNAKIENLYAEKASIGELNAVVANIGELNATKANITDLNAVKATITNLEATTAKITDLTAINAKITVLEVDTASIKNLLAGNITSENIQAGGITSDKLTIQNGFITNAMIQNLDVSKINAGTLSTNKFIIKSDDGGIEIVGATQQFKDKNNKVRIQMGKDSKGDFDIYILDETGNILFNTRGITGNAIADDLIVKDMIAGDAVGEKQIDYSSFATGFNKETNTNYIKSTHIKLDNQEQTLDIAFNKLSTIVDDTKTTTESNSTTIGIQQGQINTAINNTQIVKDGQTILLKDDYNRTVITVDSMKSTIGQHTSLIDDTTGKVEGMQSKVNTIERNLDGTTSRVEATEINIKDNYPTTSTMNSSIEQSKTGILSTVSNTYTDKNTTNNMQSTINQQANLISQKVSSGNGFSTELTQNMNSFNFNIGNANMNVWMSKNGIDMRNGALNIWDKAGRHVFGASGDGIAFSGRLQPYDNSIRLFGESCRIDGSDGAIRFQKDGKNYVSVDGTATRFFNGYSQNGTKYTSIYTDWEGHSQVFAGSSCMKLLSSGSAAVQSRWANVEQYAQMKASEFSVGSLRAYKENIHEPTEIDFMKILKENEIKAYNLIAEVEYVNKNIPSVIMKDGSNVVKADLKTGLILDDLTEEAKMILNPENGDTIALYPMISTLWKVCQEQQLKIEKLEQLQLA